MHKQHPSLWVRLRLLCVNGLHIVRFSLCTYVPPSLGCVYSSNPVLRRQPHIIACRCTCKHTTSSRRAGGNRERIDTELTRDSCLDMLWLQPNLCECVGPGRAHTLLYMLQCCNFEPCMRHICTHPCRLQVVPNARLAHHRVSNVCSTVTFVVSCVICVCCNRLATDTTPPAGQCCRTLCGACLRLLIQFIHIPPPLPLQELSAQGLLR